MGQGARTELSLNSDEVSAGQAADMLNVGRDTVFKARSVRDHGTPELQSAVDTGSVSVSAAEVRELPLFGMVS